MRHILALFTCLLLIPTALVAQEADEEDRGFIAGLLEGALGGEGRTVRVIGFSGALSSTATIEQITIADRDGIWLTIDDVALTWNRRALLRGAIDVEQLRAARIDLPRLPVAPEGIEVPDAEATPFALPDLPASIELGQMTIDAVALGEPILGEAAELSLSGTATLAGGAGNATLVAERLDGPRASFNVMAAYANETGALSLDVDVSEAADGLISGLIDLPGRPSMDLALTGKGLVNDFAAQLDLRTDGTPRLTGTLAVQEQADGPLGFDVDLDGDVSALFLPEYAAFFGPDMQLQAMGSQDPSGALSLEQFALDTRALRLNGRAVLNSNGWPTLLDIEGQISDPEGGPVLLPAGGDETRIDLADLTVRYDAQDGDALVGAITIAGLDRPDIKAQTMTLALNGTLAGDVNAIGLIEARVDLDAAGLDLSDPALQRAIGVLVRGGLDVSYADNAPLRLENLSLRGAAWNVGGDVVIQSLTEDLETTFDVTLDTPELAAFADLAGLDLSGAGRIAARGSASLGGFFDVALTGTTQDLAVGIPQADAVLTGQTTLDLAARRDETGTFLDRLTLNNAALDADVSAQLQSGSSRARYDLQLKDAGLVVDSLSGPLTLDGEANQTGDVWDVIADLAGPLDLSATVEANVAPDRIGIDFIAAVPDLNPLVPQIEGGARITASAVQSDGAWDFDSTVQGPYASDVIASGRFAGGALTADYTASLPSLDPIAPGIPGSIDMAGSVQQLPNGWLFDTTVNGPYDSTVTADGQLINNVLSADLTAALDDIAALALGINGAAFLQGNVQQVPDGWRFAANGSGPFASTVSADGALLNGVLSADYTAAIADVGAVAPGINGAASVQGNVQQVPDGWRFATDVNGPFASTANLSGTYLADSLATKFTLAVPNVAPLAPGISGPLAVDGALTQIDNGWRIDTDLRGPFNTTGSVSGTFGDIGTTARYALRVPNVGALVPQLSGAAAVTGTATQVARGFDIDAILDGPAGTAAQFQGLVGTSGRLELDARGQAQLGLINPFIAPRTIAGQVNFDVTVDGPPALTSLRGQVTTNGARLAAPNLPLSFSDLSGSVNLTGGQAILNFIAQVTEGGSINITGPINLAGALAAQLAVQLNSVVVSDRVLYTSIVNGGVTVNGPLTGGARIGGTINVGETNVQVPSSSVSTLGAIPEIDFIGATRPVMSTRERAGLVPTQADADKGDNAGGVPFPLDITVNAPSRIFVRGRGLDAQLGGGLRITGTTADTISTGQIDLIRGRLDVLGKRFDLTEGLVQLQGRFEPFLRFVAATDTTTGTARIVIEGSAQEPRITFESTPEAPQDQVLAQIFFGRDISQLSAFQALQLASAVATLAGRGGEGLVSRLRGSFGLDDLDVTTDADGNAAVRAGRFLSENVYTDVTVGGTEGAEISLNIDLTPNVTVRGSVAADSTTGLGIFIEKDY